MRLPRSPRPESRARLLWLLIPALALLTFAPVLTMWFVADDFGLLRATENLPWSATFLFFEPGRMFFRPLGGAITWILGARLFGTNALPYHALSLGLHALAAWLLGRATAAIAREPRVGWLAGALFAVYPLSTEPLAWLADQWDIWAAVCALGALWGFVAAWRGGGRRPYIAGLLAAALGLLMKESILPLPALLPLAALVSEWGPRGRGALPAGRAAWLRLLRRLAFWTLPYALPTAIFVAVRFATGGIGGYAAARTDFQHFFWDSIRDSIGSVLLPLNRDAFPRAVVQVAGFALAAAFFVSLLLWGRRRWPLVAFGAAWFLAFLVPALNLGPGASPQMLGSRLLYFPLMGACVLGGALLAGWTDAPAGRRLGWALIGLGLLAAVPTGWAQMQPWVQTSRQTQRITSEVGQIVPPPPVSYVILNARGVPDYYRGSYVFLNGFADALTAIAHLPARVTRVDTLDPAALQRAYVSARGAYNLALELDPADQLYHVSEFSGVSVAPPAPPAGGRLWNYAGCAPGPAPGWQVWNATLTCAEQPQAPPPGAARYAELRPAGDDPGLALPDLRFGLGDIQGLRLAVCARLPAAPAGLLGEWFWGAARPPLWSRDRSRPFAYQPTSAWRVYWAYLPMRQTGRDWAGLRFDPVNAQTPVDIAWISVTAVR
jgi:hypothetical protein